MHFQLLAFICGEFAHDISVHQIGSRRLKKLKLLFIGEKLALELIATLDEDQQKLARQKERFPETPEAKAAPGVGAPKGLAAAKMTVQPPFPSGERDVARPAILLYRFEFCDEVACTLPPLFRVFHPENVFFLSTIDTRVDQFVAAGFHTVTLTDMSQWACTLLEQRLRVVRVFAGSADRIFGAESRRLIEGTLASALDAIRAGAIRPTLFVCRI